MLRIILNKHIINSIKFQILSTNYTIQKLPCLSSSLLLKENIQYFSCRYKKKEAKSKENFSSESEKNESDDFLDTIQDKNTKILNIGVTSLRVDGILKSSLGMARNKIEMLFYESKIRVNGEKILKKSASVKEGDEIDVIKGPDIKNPNFTIVARVEILSITAKEDSINVKIRRCKSLSVADYNS